MEGVLHPPRGQPGLSDHPAVHGDAAGGGVHARAPLPLPVDPVPADVRARLPGARRPVDRRDQPQPDRARRADHEGQPDGSRLPRRGPAPDVTAGQAGIEKSYDGWLRGSDGETAQMFDACGPAGALAVPRPRAGDGASVRLTLDAHLQKVAQGAIYRGMQIAHADRQYYADYGTVVAMNPQTGAVYAMASYPTYKPTVWVPPYDGQGRIVDPKNKLFPQVDKSFAGTYPPGLHVQADHRRRAWMSGIIGPGSTRPCTIVLPVPERPEPPQVQQLGAGELDHRPLEGARDLVRHVLLPARRPVLRALSGRLEHLPGVDPEARLRRSPPIDAPGAVSGTSRTGTGRRTTRCS